MVERCRKWIERHARRGNLTWSVLRIAGIPIERFGALGVRGICDSYCDYIIWYM